MARSDEVSQPQEQVTWVVMNYCDVGPTTKVYNGPSLENAISACVAMNMPRAHFCRIENGEVQTFSLLQARQILREGGYDGDSLQN